MTPRHDDSTLSTVFSGVSRRQALGIAGGLVLAAGALVRRADAAENGAPTKDTFAMAIPVDPDGLDPQRTAAAMSFEIANNIYDPLVKIKPDGTLIPGLAQGWKVSDDGLQVTFDLRPGVVFSNGNPCDAAAVVASFERLQSAESPRAGEYAGFSFSAPDDATVVVTSETLNVAMLASFAYAWSAVVDVTAADTLANKPVGTGPYVLESWNPQTTLTLKANPLYWGEPPLTPTVVLRVLPDTTSQVSSLRAGDVDLLWDQTGSQALILAGDPSVQVLEYPGNGVQLMAMNCANAYLADERVRQAIAMAVDKDALIEAAWWGFGTKIGSHFPYGIPGYVDCTGTYAYDPAAARALLQEAGYGDGITLKMRLPESYPVYVSAGQIIADSLKQVGISCDIEIIDWGTWLSDVYVGRNYDLTVVGHTGRLDPITMLARYASDSGENYFNYANPAIDDLIAAYRGELDEQARLDIVAQIQQILARDVPALYIQSPIMVYPANAKLTGFEQYVIDIYEFKDVAVGA